MTRHNETTLWNGGGDDDDCCYFCYYNRFCVITENAGSTFWELDHLPAPCFSHPDERAASYVDAPPVR